MTQEFIPDEANLVEHLPLKIYTEQAYLDYSMYVILDRALPHISDGLKPVQRRIIYAMSELGLKASVKYKKSARTVGDVLGKFHPHGDTACYEAMVLMAQSFSYRYPLIDGQGNWGSLDDPKSFAAMRYTEARLAPFAEILLSELQQGTVDWQPNFDATLEEPCHLPARLPQLLLNGGTGIAVGMATDILPHNLCEVVQACICLLENPKADINMLLQYLKGPDFPTSAEIISSQSEIAEAYKTGKGTVKMRAIYREEEGDIVITALPYRVSGAKVIAQIVKQMETKKLPLVMDVRDESNHEQPTRLVIVPRSNRVDREQLMSHLFATTELEKSYRINLNVIGLDGKPQVKNIHEILTEWLDYRLQTVKRKLQHRLQQVEDRLHIIAGLLIVYENLDAVIRIIREADDPSIELQKKFKLTERQAEHILNIRLRQLAKLVEEKLKLEQVDLTKEQKKINTLLASKKKLQKHIIKELEQDAKTFGDSRRSPIVVRNEAKALQTSELLSVEQITVVLSKKGWIRAAKGHEIDPTGLAYRSGDDLLAFVRGRSNQEAMFFDQSGRSYTLETHSLPSARSLGEPLTGRLQPPSGTEFVGLLTLQENMCDSHLVLLASNLGYGFTATYVALQTKNKTGKSIISLAKDAILLPPVLFPQASAATLEQTTQKQVDKTDDNYIILLSSRGHLLVLAAELIPTMTKGKGVKLIHLLPKERVIDVVVANVTQTIEVQTTGKRSCQLQPKQWLSYQGTRGRSQGKPLANKWRKLSRLFVLS